MSENTIDNTENKERRVFRTREILDYPPVLQACHIQELLGFSEGKTYQVLRSNGCPTVREGKRMVAPRDMFWAWFLERATKSMNGGASRD